MRVLGISAFHSDAAAALLEDGQVVAAAQEERFSSKPRDPAFPRRAIRFCLQNGGIQARDLDLIVFYEKPLRKFERVLATQLGAFPKSARSFSRSVFVWLGDRLWIKNHIAKELGVPVDRIGFAEHQTALAAHAVAAAGLSSAAVLTVDDAGEWASTSLGRCQGGTIEMMREVHFPHSLGFVNSAFTQYLGFAPGADEHLVEALSAHGSPSFADAIREIVPRVEGGFRVADGCFRYAFDADRLYGDGLVDRLGPPRFSGDPLCWQGDDRRHADLAASLQVVLEERVLELATDLEALLAQGAPDPDAAVAGDASSVDAGERNGARSEDLELCFAGELARNTRVVRRLVENGPFARVRVPHAPGKAGGAVGAAWLGCRSLLEDSAAPSRPLRGVAWGESVDQRAEAGAVAAPQPIEALRGRLLDGQRVAWVRSRMEFGDRSLGHRSVLGLPGREDAVRALLGAIQHVEAFLPARLLVTAPAAATYLRLDLQACPEAATGAMRVAATQALRDAAPGLVEPDGLVQAQLVDAGDDPELYVLLDCIGSATGHPLLLHADFAPRGAPLVRSEADAVEAFRRSSLDALLVADRIYAAEPAPS